MSLLEDYIIALTNLYGIVSPEKVREIYNKQNKDHVSIDDVSTYLDQPTDDMTSSFVTTMQGSFVSDSIKEFNQFDYFKGLKGNKPYYVPDKQQLLKYTDHYYLEEPKEYHALVTFVDQYLLLDEIEAENLCSNLYDICQLDFSMSSVTQELSRRDITLGDMKEADQLLKLITQLANNVRLWENNGFTPKELHESMEVPTLKSLKQERLKQQQPSEKIGRNDPCPCGSGKKYKKCCMTKASSL